jgi:adenylylsulfate kinase
MVIWLIGLSGAGKTAIGKALVKKLREVGRPVVFMDGDIFRDIMGNDLGHSIDDRKKNADRVCRFCKYVDKEGFDIVFAILSIFQESQEWNRENIIKYFEVYIDVSIDTLRDRDPKGLYKKVFDGEIKNVVGVDIPFNPPPNADMVIDNNEFTDNFEEIVNRIINRLKTKEFM